MLNWKELVLLNDDQLADLDILVACIGRDGRPRRLPSALRAALTRDRPAIAPRAP